MPLSLPTAFRFLCVQVFNDEVASFAAMLNTVHGSIRAVNAAIKGYEGVTEGVEELVQQLSKGHVGAGRGRKVEWLFLCWLLMLWLCASSPPLPYVRPLLPSAIKPRRYQTPPLSYRPIPNHGSSAEKETLSECNCEDRTK